MDLAQGTDADGLAGALGSWPGLAGPGKGLPPPVTITIWATAAVPISTNNTMIVMRVWRRMTRPKVSGAVAATGRRDGIGPQHALGALAHLDHDRAQPGRIGEVRAEVHLE